MFRPMRRSNQQFPEKDCIEILKTEPRGILSVLGEDGYPYGIPMNHFYREADGKLYFHCAKEGHKLDAVRACDKASFCVLDKGVKSETDELHAVVFKFQSGLHLITSSLLGTYLLPQTSTAPYIFPSTITVVLVGCPLCTA